jgi:hypothetical protein
MDTTKSDRPTPDDDPPARLLTPHGEEHRSFGGSNVDLDRRASAATPEHDPALHSTRNQAADLAPQNTQARRGEDLASVHRVWMYRAEWSSPHRRRFRP